MRELLSPAGDWECLESAVTYGANAVYLGGKQLGMRATPKNFTDRELKAAVEYAHSNGVKIYLTCNILPRNSMFKELPEYLDMAVDAGVDALIVTDLGVLSVIKRRHPGLEVHISTQAGIVNYESANMLYELGAKRVVLARELSIDEISEIRAKTPSDLQLEAFVHGAMCMSFSGRCILSNYLTDRDANQGACSQPCRWGYHLVEEKRPGEYYPIYEDESGTYILNAKDLCMLEHLDKLADAGVESFKIEGRAKSSYYVSVVTNAYAAALSTEELKAPSWSIEEVGKVSHRSYSTGFYFGRPKDSEYYKNAGYVRDYDVIGVVVGGDNDRLRVEVRNKFSPGEEAELLVPGKPPELFAISDIYDENGAQLTTANKPKSCVILPIKSFEGVLNAASIPLKSILRRKVVQSERI